jgi:hypothetical protein
MLQRVKGYDQKSPNHCTGTARECNIGELPSIQFKNRAVLTADAQKMLAGVQAGSMPIQTVK